MKKREEIIMREACSAMKTEGGLCVSTTLTVLRRSEMDKSCLVRCCNRIAARGAEPVGVQVTLLVPFSHPEAGQLQEELQTAAQELGLEITAWDKIETQAVTRPVVTLCVQGKCPRERLVYPEGMRPGDKLLLAGYAGAEGTLRLAREAGQQTLRAEDKEQVLAQEERMNCVKESLMAAPYARAMLEVGEGGFLTALYQLCEASQCGAYVEEKEIPVLDSTRLVCRERVLDPLRLASLGCLLIATDRDKQVTELLQRAGIPCKVVGKAVGKAQGRRIMCLDGMLRPIGKPRGDELTKVHA